MHWEVLIIPLIALGVWIFGTLFKSEDEKAKKAVGRRGNVSGRAPARRVVTDLDRFLEEARRRREPEVRRKAPPPPPRGVPAARPPVRERPARTQGTPRIAPPVIIKKEAIVVVPVAHPIAQPPLAQPVAAAPVVREAPPPAPVARPSPIAQQVRSLLSKPQSAATAFALREIFDRPLCKRRR
jgi:hypothetical protein